MRISFRLLIFLYLIYPAGLFAKKQGRPLLDSLISALPQAKEDTAKVKLLGKISIEYVSINPDSGLNYGNAGLALALKLNWKNGTAFCYEEIGSNYWAKNAYPKALDNFFKALKINEDLHNSKERASNLGNIGLIYRAQNDNEKALEYLFKALTLQKATNRYPKDIAANLTNIGLIYDAQKDYPKALRYITEALNIFKKLGESSIISDIQSNIAGIYLDMKDLPQSLNYYYKALKLDQSLGRKNGIAMDFGNIGEVYLAIANGENRTLLPDSLKDKSSSLHKAHSFLMEGINRTKGLRLVDALQEFYHQMSEVQKQSHDYKGAFESFNLSVAIKDSLFSQDNRQQIAVLEAKREAEVKDKEAEIQKLEKEAKKEREESRERLQIMGIGAFIMIFITVILLMIRRRINHRFIEILGTFSILSLFEYITLLVHPTLENVTNHNIIFTFACLVILASVLVPIHHKIEHWLKEKIGVIAHIHDSVPAPGQIEDEKVEDAPVLAGVDAEEGES